MKEAIEATVHQLAEAERARVEEEERRYLERFRPHIIIVPKRSWPEPIFVAALIGVERILRRELDRSRGPETFVAQALAIVPTVVVAFGETAGFVINYTPDEAVKYDLAGNLLAMLTKAERPGHADLTLKNGRSVVPLIRVELPEQT